MKVAVCYNGIAKGNNDFGRVIDYNLALCTHKHFLFDANNADVFIHTGSVNEEKTLKTILKPKKAIFEKQILFDSIADEKIEDRTDKGRYQRHSIMSRGYSQKEVIKLKRDYEKANNFVYDGVVIIRFDVILNSLFDLKILDSSKLYLSNGEAKHLKNGFLDYGILCNSVHANIIGELYDEIRENFYYQNYDADPGWGSHALLKRHIRRRKLLSLVKLYKYEFEDHGLLRDCNFEQTKLKY